MMCCVSACSWWRRACEHGRIWVFWHLGWVAENSSADLSLAAAHCRGAADCEVPRPACRRRMAGHIRGTNDPTSPFPTPSSFCPLFIVFFFSSASITAFLPDHSILSHVCGCRVDASAYESWVLLSWRRLDLANLGRHLASGETNLPTSPHPMTKTIRSREDVPRRFLRSKHVR